jgi:hypothetical protein
MNDARDEGNQNMKSLSVKGTHKTSAAKECAAATTKPSK